MKTLINSALQIFRSLVSNSNNSPIAYQEVKQQSKFSKTKFRKQDLLVATLRCFTFAVLITTCLISQTQNAGASNTIKPLTANVITAVMSFSDFFSIIAALIIAGIAFYLSFKPSKNQPKKSF